MISFTVNKTEISNFIGVVLVIQVYRYMRKSLGQKLDFHKRMALIHLISMVNDIMEWWPQVENAWRSGLCSGSKPLLNSIFSVLEATYLGTIGSVYTFLTYPKGRLFCKKLKHYWKQSILLSIQMDWMTSIDDGILWAQRCNISCKRQ